MMSVIALSVNIVDRQNLKRSKKLSNRDQDRADLKLLLYLKAVLLFALSDFVSIFLSRFHQQSL